LLKKGKILDKAGFISTNTLIRHIISYNLTNGPTNSWAFYRAWDGFITIA